MSSASPWAPPNRVCSTDATVPPPPCSEEGDDVVVGHRRRPQHLVDLPVGEALAQHVQRQALELRLVAGSRPSPAPSAPSLRGPARRRAGTGSTGSGLSAATMGSTAARRPKKLPVVPSEKGACDPPMVTRGSGVALLRLQLPVEEGAELAPRVVEDDHRALLAAARPGARTGSRGRRASGMGSGHWSSADSGCRDLRPSW